MKSHSPGLGEALLGLAEPRAGAVPPGLCSPHPDSPQKGVEGLITLSLDTETVKSRTCPSALTSPSSSAGRTGHQHCHLEIHGDKELFSGFKMLGEMGKICRWSCGVQMVLLCTAARDGDRSVVMAVMVQRYFIRAVVPVTKYLLAGPRNNGMVISDVRQLWNEQTEHSQGRVQTLPCCFLQRLWAELLCWQWAAASRALCSLPPLFLQGLG